MTTLEFASDKVDGIVDDLEGDYPPSEEMRTRASEIAEAADFDWPVNRAPSVVAASAVYLAGLLVNEKFTQQEVAAASEVSIVAIRDGYQELADHCEVAPGQYAVNETRKRRRSGDGPSSWLDARLNEVFGK